jgi:hypothetical protein
MKKAITWHNITATPKDWAKMIGVSYKDYKKVVSRVGWKNACDLRHYEELLRNERENDRFEEIYFDYGFSK